tara:strand:- start:87 stop:398 length:312 start_codon:yes stop_codon:yes gene_type:complete
MGVVLESAEVCDVNAESLSTPVLAVKAEHHLVFPRTTHSQTAAILSSVFVHRRNCELDSRMIDFVSENFIERIADFDYATIRGKRIEPIWAQPYQVATAEGLY